MKMTTTSNDDELLKALRERAKKREELRDGASAGTYGNRAKKREEATLRSRTQMAYVAAVMAVLAAGFSVFLVWKLSDARAELRSAHADLAVQSAWIDALEEELNAPASKPEPDEITEDDLAFAEDLARLAGIDEQIEAAGFESVEEVLEHLALHHGQLSRCSASLADCRSWLGWCQGGFWRPEAGP